MSATIITLDEEHGRVVSEKATALGKTPEAYLYALIEADAQSFDDLLDPVRRGFDGISDAEADALIAKAQRAGRIDD